MNLLSRAITSHHFLLSTYRHSTKCLFSPRPISAFHHQISLYSTSNQQINTTRLRTQQTRKPRTPKPSESSSSPPASTWSKGVMESTDTLLPTWPRPSEIPYQSKVANSVNLIGHIQLPVQFHLTPDGKHLAATVIVQEIGTNTPLLHSKSSVSVVIPVVFEGDLAHIVACHVKQNDCVYVTGKLCVDPLPFVLTENQGKFHILGQEINFVQGYDKKILVSAPKNSEEAVNVVSKVDKSDEDGLLSLGSDELENMELNDIVVEKSLKVSYNGVESLKMDDNDNADEKSSKADYKRLNKDTDSIFNSWRDLVRNPKEWWDNREDKSNGFRKANYPDFKHKTSGNGLWLNKAPQWVLPGLQGLEFDVQIRRGQNAKGGKEEDNWKSLVENPEKWWDNRLGKRNVKAPDFKHKETGEGLWLNSLPDWVLSRVPPLKDEKPESPRLF